MHEEKISFKIRDLGRQMYQLLSHNENLQNVIDLTQFEANTICLLCKIDEEGDFHIGFCLDYITSKI